MRVLISPGSPIGHIAKVVPLKLFLGHSQSGESHDANFPRVHSPSSVVDVFRNAPGEFDSQEDWIPYLKILSKGLGVRE